MKIKPRNINVLVKDSAFLILFSIVLTILQFLQTNIIDQAKSWFGMINEFWINLFIIITSGIIIYFFLKLLKKLSKKNKDSRLLPYIYKGQPEVTLSRDVDPERISDFQMIRDEAKKTIYVMGIGMTLFSQDKHYLQRLLESGINVRLLMMNPAVIDGNTPIDETPSVKMNKETFEEFFSRIGYSEEIVPSCNRLCDIIDKYKIEKKSSYGEIELRLYPYFLPMNFTCADEIDQGSMLLEFCLPFSDCRVRIKSSRKDHEELFTSIIEILSFIWTNSKILASSRKTLWDSGEKSK